MSYIAAEKAAETYKPMKENKNNKNFICILYSFKIVDVKKTTCDYVRIVKDVFLYHQ